MKEFTNDLRELSNKLELLLKNKSFEFLMFLSSEGEDAFEEIKLYKLDYEKYGYGVFLWWGEKYPKFIRLFNLIMKTDIFPGIPVLGDMKEVIDEYLDLIDKSKSNNPSLFLEEINNSKSLFFNKTIKPIKILETKNPFIGYIFNETNKSIKELIPFIDKDFKKNVPKVTEYLKEYKNYIEDIKPLISKNLEFFKKLWNNEITNEEFENLTNVQSIKIEELKKRLNAKGERLLEEIQKNRESDKELIDFYSNKAKELEEITKKVIGSDIKKLIYEYIRLIKDIDSYHIQFMKFIKRLFHILIHNNRAFINDKNCYYLIKPKKYNPKTRNSLKRFLATEFNQKFPKLSKFFLKCFSYNIFRRLEAHEIPDNIYISDDEKYAYIPQTGNRQDLRMDIPEIKKFINTYCLFIEALNLT